MDNIHRCMCDCADIFTQMTDIESNRENKLTEYVVGKQRYLSRPCSLVLQKYICPICLGKLDRDKSDALSKMYHDFMFEEYKRRCPGHVRLQEIMQKKLQDEDKKNHSTIGKAIGRALSNGMNAVSSAHNKSNDDLFNDAVNSSGWKKAAAMQELKNRSGGGGCFITTAVCGSFNKPDDCYELTMFRDFRDNWLALQADGKELIQRYYQIAPAIVKKINGLSDANTIYLSIWKEYLQPCLRYLEGKNYLACKQKYVQMVDELSRRF